MEFDKIVELVGKPVRVKLAEETTLCGFLLNVDPLSLSVFLLFEEQSEEEVEFDADEKNFFIKMILGHAVKSVELDLFSDSDKLLSEEQISDIFDHIVGLNQHEANESKFEMPTKFFTVEEAKASLLGWLTKNGIQYETSNETTVKILNGSVHIEPPYFANNVICDKISFQKEVKKMVSKWRSES
ncbi:hypothetical protein HK098_006439 [Nowakowskiella sp. JEL0407]|nr:hypothetical protein HK098_006439 [Nowakowskiella sp. JEL0407]